jgi:hypothetical protein
MQAFQLPSSFNESIYFDYAPPPTFAGHINRHPFRIIITSSNDNPHVITLDSKFSKSYKNQNDKSKWSFLRPQTRFLDLSGNEIDSIVSKDTTLYKTKNGVINSVSGNFIGVSGYAEFYFVDDIYNYDFAIKDEQYTTIVAVLETSGINYFDKTVADHILTSRYSNSKAVAYQPHVFHYRDPDNIKISENGIREFINPRWVPADQHVVFSFNWNKEYSQLFYDGNEIMPINFDFNFNKSIPSNTNKNDIQVDTEGDAIRLYFNGFLKTFNVSYLNQDKYLSPGYYKTFFNVGTATSNLKLSATSTFDSPNIFGSDYSPRMWLSNPNAGLMALVEYNFPKTFALDSKALLKANIHNFEVPIVYDANFRKNDFGESEDAFAFSGFHGINSIAVLPPPSFQAWATDGELNYLYKFGTKGQILSAIDLLKMLKDQGQQSVVADQVSPTSVVLDKYQELWVTLHDSRFVIHLDKNGNYIYLLDLTTIPNSLIPGLPPQITYTTPPDMNIDWYKANQSYPDDGVDNQYFIQPTFVDVDSKNKLWVTYSNYVSGYLAKYDINNNRYQTISYPVCSCPQDLIIDNKDNVWVALSNNIWNSIGSIEKRDTNGVLLSSYGNIMGVNELALDPQQNLWFTYSYGRLGCIDNNTGLVTTFNVLSNSDISKYAPNLLTIPDKNTDETALEGIACDLKGYLYVVNSIENQVYVYNTKTKTYVDKFYVNPQGFVFWNPYVDGPTLMEYNQWSKSLQAHGDWMGTKWINKFKNNNSTYQLTVTGQSNSLKFINAQSANIRDNYSFLATTFYRYIDTNYIQQIKVTPEKIQEPTIDYYNVDVFKINENYDLGAQMKSYAITPTLFESDYLFNKFLPSIYGQFPYTHQDLGVHSYEKIANYVINHSDVDTCEIDKLYSLADSIDNNTNDYILNYPAEIKRLMDVFSINQSRLLGSVQKNQNNFIVQDKDGSFNRGQLLTSTYMVTAGTPVILKTRSLNSFQFIPTGPLYISPLPYEIESLLNNFKEIILSLDNTPKTTPSGHISDESYSIATRNILKYKSELQQQVIDYANYYYPQAMSNNPTLTAKCYRDSGYVIDAIVADINNNANHRSIEVGNMYFKGVLKTLTTGNGTTIPVIPQNQVDATVATISALNFYINGIDIPQNPQSFTSVGILSSPTMGSYRQNDVSARIENVIYPLQNNGELNDYIPAGTPTPQSINLANQILSSKNEIQTNIAYYVKNKGYLDLTPPNVELTNDYAIICRRDVGLMIDAITHDLEFGVNARSIQYALAYWNGSSTRLPDSLVPQHKAKTIDTINQLGKSMLAIYEQQMDTTPLTYKLDVYPIQNLANFIGINNNDGAWEGYYEFYEFVPTVGTIYSDNVVDWDNQQTTLTKNISSIFDWLGDEQQIDTLFSYKLYTGLGII